MHARLILASTSRYRATLLERLGLAFAQEGPGVEEAPLAGETPRDRALRLACDKAAAVAARHPDAWVLGSDQLAVRDGAILGKPLDTARCESQLLASSGREVDFLTAVCLLNLRAGARLVHVDTTRVKFRVLSPAEVTTYVAREQPLDCAGGFKCEGLGIALFDRIESSDPTALIGLPLIWVARALREAGLDPLG